MSETKTSQQQLVRGFTLNGRSSARPRFPMRARRLAWLVALVLLVGSNLAWALAIRAGGDEEIRVDAVARRFTENVMSFSHDTLEADIDRLKIDTTPDFFRRVGSLLGDDVTLFRDAVRDAEAVSAARVRGTDITSLRKDRAEVLVVVEQTVGRQTLDDGQRLVRVFNLTIAKTGGAWKVADLTGAIEQRG